MTLARIFEPAAYDEDADTGNYWRTTVDDTRANPPLDGGARAEFAVIGGGFTGLSAALHLAEAGADVALLDMHGPGWGASGRNGGFACLGGAKASHRSLLRRHGAEDTFRFHRTERKAVELVGALLERHGIDADRHSHGETLLAHRRKDFNTFDDEAHFAETAYGAQAEVIAKSDLAAHGLAGPEFEGALTVRCGFALNPRKYVIGLAHAALDAGVRIHGRSAVMALRRDGADYVLETAEGELRARNLLLATNGYSADDLPAWMRARYLPVQTSIIVTRPLTETEIVDQGWSSDQMARDTRHLLHYFRLMPNRRFLFGMRGGVRVSEAEHARIRRKIRSDFDRMFPAWREVETPHFWSGLACLARNLTPYVGPIGDWPRAHAAFAYHGNGVAMGSWSGAQLAARALGRRPDIPDLMQHPPRHFPFGGARRALLPVTYALYTLLDR